MNGRATLLGTGTSTGIPIIGCDCKVCTSSEERDKRLRCSCLVETENLTVLIDAGPDLREQALTHNIRRIDAVVFSHHHFDHVGGIDDLRPFFFDNREPIPCFADDQTRKLLHSMFSYIFEDGSYPGIPKLKLCDIDGPSINIASRYGHSETLEVIPVPVFHGAIPILGYRIGSFAYITDTNGIPESSLALLQDLDTLVLDGLRPFPHQAHFSISEAVDAATEIGAKQTYLIHMSHHVGHVETDASLPAGINLAYDGLQIDFEV